MPDTSNAEILRAITELHEAQSNRLERIEMRIKVVEEQTTKTNGRVTQLETKNLLQIGREQGAADVHATWRRRTAEVVGIGTMAAGIAAGIVAFLKG